MLKKIVIITFAFVFMFSTAVFAQSKSNTQKGYDAGKKTRQYYDNTVKPKVESTQQKTAETYNKAKEQTGGFIKGLKKK